MRRTPKTGTLTPSAFRSNKPSAGPAEAFRPFCCSGKRAPPFLPPPWGSRSVKMRCNPVVFVPFFLLLACSGPLAPVAPRLMVRFLDVGPGDAALITWPGGQRLLVDAGPDSGGADTLLINSGVTSL